MGRLLLELAVCSFFVFAMVSSASAQVLEGLPPLKPGPMLDPDDPRREEKEAARKSVERLTEEINKSPKTDPIADAKLFEKRGDALMTLGESKKAFDDYSKAIEIYTPAKASPWLIEDRISAAVESGDFRSALNDAEMLTEGISPPQPKYFAIYAMILARSPDGKVKDAERALDNAIYANAIRRRPSEAVIVEIALAAAYSVNGDFASAVKHQEKAIKAVKDRGGEPPKYMQLQLEAYKQKKELPFGSPEVERNGQP